ncbi:MAG: MXAN_5187 C-terminal domain-containing protein, partial [Deltaproteobacteria bacterium]
APAPPLPPPRAPAAAPAPGPDMRALYERYVDARRRNNERVDNVRLESRQQSVENMMPQLREKPGNKSIDFDVVVQDGKVGLKPRVR